MKQQLAVKIEFIDLEPPPDNMLREVLSGLRKPQKELPSKYFYDERGSQLFEQICTLEDYYPTRTELRILQTFAPEIAALLGERVQLVEYGSGSSKKTRLLLAALHKPGAYVPIDISKECLLTSAINLALLYPGLAVLPVCADYTTPFHIPEPGNDIRQRVAFFPGSTIGNFDPQTARRFLARVASNCQGLLIGVDLKKAFSLLHRAYNDSEQVTACFNKNILTRINRELAADFNLAQFEHYACYNPGQNRVEMHLVSVTDQVVCVGDVKVPFKPGESIWTESSYKYTPEEFATLAAEAGFRVEHVWTDEQKWFSVQYLTTV